jgi:CBS domain-containing protein
MLIVVSLVVLLSAGATAFGFDSTKASGDAKFFDPTIQLPLLVLALPRPSRYTDRRSGTEVILMHTVRELLREKGSQVWTIGPQATVYEALQLMAAKNIGAVVVLEHGKVAGVFTERDYARKVVLQGRSSKTTSIAESMTPDVLYVSPDDTIEDCMALMTDKRLRHLPVMDGGKLAGVVSIGDVVKVIISEHKFTIRELERYITGGHSSIT